MLLFIRKNFVFTFAYVLCVILTDYLFGSVRCMDSFVWVTMYFGSIGLDQYVVWL